MKTSIYFFTLFILFLSCNHQQKTLRTANKVAYLQPIPPSNFCGVTNVVLNTPPGFDGTLTPLFAGLTENFTYPITTKSKVAQKYFDQGLVLSYGFNHPEAARSFKEATRQDPDCAVCYWGLGYVLGPNYNDTMSKDVLTEANEAIQNARLRADKCSPKENALIIALSKRYPKNDTANAKPFYKAYADAMKGVQTQFPEDLDIAALYAESLMDLHPWEMWFKNGEPRSWTPEILDILEGILKKNPRHVQAVHLYIHATEASKIPERAIPYANTLRALIPGSGHLLHMPSHTYINTGHYHEGSLANERAVKMDSNYIETCHIAGVYPIGYNLHNWHFLAGSSVLEGRGKRALEASQYMSKYAESKGLQVRTFSQVFYAVPWYIMVKFSMWDKILAEPKPNDSLAYPTAVWTYAQGMALAATGKTQNALAHLSQMKKFETDTMIKKIYFNDSTSATRTISIARYVLEGEIAYRNGDFPTAIKTLREAVKKEDNLYYDEPPDWFLSVRHHLGRVLMEAGQYAEAEKTYREDLTQYKENGWALMGLYQSLRGQGKKTEAQAVKYRYDTAWQFADKPLTSSVF